MTIIAGNAVSQRSTGQTANWALYTNSDFIVKITVESNASGSSIVEFSEMIGLVAGGTMLSICAGVAVIGTYLALFCDIVGKSRR